MKINISASLESKIGLIV